jgi:hypothetical protein
VRLLALRLRLAQLAQNDACGREAARTKKMIVDLGRTVQLLDFDITTEEERTRISNRSDAAYPVLARMLAARRDNLRKTIAALEQRFSKLDRASWSSIWLKVKVGPYQTSQYTGLSDVIIERLKRPYDV